VLDPANRLASMLTTGPRYGWLGGKQRATETGVTGLTLMGVRLYSPILKLCKVMCEKVYKLSCYLGYS